MKAQGLAKLLGFAKALESMPQALRQAEEATMRDWTKRVSKQFATTTNPYGARWKPRKSGGTAPVLTGKTRQLRRMKLVRLAGHRWSIVSGHQDIVGYHQDGTSRMVSRKIFPDGRGLPKAWRAAGVKIHKQKLKEHFGR